MIQAVRCYKPFARLRFLRGCRDEAGGIDLPGAVVVVDGGVQGVVQAQVSDLKGVERKRPMAATCRHTRRKYQNHTPGTASDLALMGCS